ncbi:MAG TPA: D-sedoheptulose 7-phosphate isomerase [Chitinophagaceae bacterium]|jgi:D-sedoheptulose 7-phosphate isomerase|nr:D-sedoheptulose 7-phosphate isomerase [Chitinophagaceae bacterium]
MDQLTTTMITERITASIEVKKQMLTSEKLLATIEAVQGCVSKAFRKGGKVLFCGNGGSAADAQHLAAEFSGRFYKNRPPLYAEALHCNTSYLTAVANDFSFADVYARMVEAMGRPGDILIALSTSGNSENVLRAIVQAKKKEMITVGLTGESGGRMKDLCHYLIDVPSGDTPRIQEAHIMTGHIICEQVETDLF